MYQVYKLYKLLCTVPGGVHIHVCTQCYKLQVLQVTRLQVTSYPVSHKLQDFFVYLPSTHT